MNRKLIVFSALFTAVIGAVIGLAAARMHHGCFASSLYQDLGRKYAIAGATAGLLVGAGQEAVRQLKHQRDTEEAQLNQAHWVQPRLHHGR
ncbi:hypothetical protein OOK60_05650 [Trichothermofontia sichuanensis B231]|uniref:hypothetical protein n=1 Tax=Trichothermofontia sichuanensis TaxID=3045816 RepID=UPI00224713AF|nr:hypothetical protein [Trichothermofontia sichuanensis]UZQ55557.1 hypothetical protein OOK60_05650 [Trichothermofontia sichuanensis B231]